jgi:hypothetical protein
MKLRNGYKNKMQHVLIAKMLCLTDYDRFIKELVTYLMFHRTHKEDCYKLHETK